MSKLTKSIVGLILMLILVVLLPFLSRSVSNIRILFKITLFFFLKKLVRYKAIIFHIPKFKIFLMARLKSLLFNDIYNEVSLYA